MICSTPDCPASRERDEFGRLTPVQWGACTQSVLTATGYHVLNRVTDGTIARHVAAWKPYEKARALANLDSEAERLTMLLGIIDEARKHLRS